MTFFFGSLLRKGRGLKKRAEVASEELLEVNCIGI
jgi:hypothetical protein